MAKEDTGNLAEKDEWEEVQVGMGEEWDFEKNGDLVGTFLQARIIELPEKSWTKQEDGEIRKTSTIFEFALDGTGEQVFIWESYQVVEGMKDATTGTRVKVQFTGVKDFDGGKRRVKQYKFFIAK